jgi:uncharacterized protein YegP (UPF0339 family)
MDSPHYECRFEENKRGQWFWHLVQPDNHKIVGDSSEDYTERNDCVEQAHRIFDGAPNVTIIDDLADAA